MKIKSRNILITGASSGIGRMTAIQIARQGGYPVLIARRTDRLEEIALTIEKMNGKKPLALAADILQENDRNAIGEFVRDRVGDLNVLINNAGITAHGRFLETDLQVARDAMELNFFATAALTKTLLPYMQSTPGEKMIVYVSTPSALHGIPERYAYSASKAAGNMLAETIRLEHRSDNIKTLIFSPGYTRTELRNSGLGPDGSTINEDQAGGAKGPDYVARKLIQAIHKNKRIAFTDTNGRGVYWLRVLAPWFLEQMILKKTT